MVTFDSPTVTNIFLPCIALFNIVLLAILYEHYYKKEANKTAKKNK